MAPVFKISWYENGYKSEGKVEALDISAIDFRYFLIQRFQLFNIVIPIEYFVTNVWVNERRKNLTASLEHD